MNQTLVEQVANAVLYEGYILYPYRPSVKNRQRWTFGGLYPEAYARLQGGTEPASMQTECLVVGTARTRLDVRVRFLHLLARTVGQLASPLRHWPQGQEPPFRPVAALRVGDKLWQTWQEAVERDVRLPDLGLKVLSGETRQQAFSFAANRTCEPLASPGGDIVGVLVRAQQAVQGCVQVSAAAAGDGLFRLRVVVDNRTPLPEAVSASRDEALLRALVSTHTILGVREGEFVSLLDTPTAYREAAAACRNVGTWPVLVGDEGAKDCLLSSPIILYDYPRIAPESPGDLFDGTEIDEILTLRILTLTEGEKRAMAAVDERARALLDRTESLSGEHLLQLHGTMRSSGPGQQEEP